MNDEMEFQLTQLRLQYDSKFTGLANEYERILGLELDGIDDILEYEENEAIKSAIKERISRARKVIANINKTRIMEVGNET